MVVGWKHTHASPDHSVDLKSGVKCALLVVPKTAWDSVPRAAFSSDVMLCGCIFGELPSLQSGLAIYI